MNNDLITFISWIVTGVFLMLGFYWKGYSNAMRDFRDEMEKQINKKDTNK